MCGGGILAGMAGLAFGGPLGLAMGLEGAAANIIGGGLVGGLTSAATGGDFLTGIVAGGLGGWGGAPGAVDSAAFAAGAPGASMSAAEIQAAMAGAGDAIGQLSMAESITGLSGTAATQALGYGSTEAMWAALSPLEVGIGSQLMAGPSNMLNSLGMPGAGQAVGGFQMNPASLLNATGQNQQGSGQRFGPVSGALNVGSGIYGLMESRKMRETAEQMARSSDPFGQYRAGYAQQLQALNADPSRITSMPGYQAGLEAVQRSMMSQGYGGSGNMMLALSKYGGDFYNQQVQQLAGLAGAQFSPASAAQIGFEGNVAGAQLAGHSLNRLALGAGAMGF